MASASTLRGVAHPPDATRVQHRDMHHFSSLIFVAAAGLR